MFNSRRSPQFPDLDFASAPPEHMLYQGSVLMGDHLLRRQLAHKGFWLGRPWQSDIPEMVGRKQSWWPSPGEGGVPFPWHHVSQEGPLLESGPGPLPARSLCPMLFMDQSSESGRTSNSLSFLTSSLLSNCSALRSQTSQTWVGDPRPTLGWRDRAS